MRKWLALVLGAALLAGCASAPADSLAPSAAQSAVQSETAQTAATPAPTADTRAEQTAVLDGFVAFGADTAGGSLKTAQTAAKLVEYLSVSDLEVDVVTDWRAGLTDDQQAMLDLNWPGILAEAQAICDDPAAQADELSAAGVETDFAGMELAGVPGKLAEADGVLGK